MAVPSKGPVPAGCHALAALAAWVWSNVLSGTQSKKCWPTPFECCVWQAFPAQQPVPAQQVPPAPVPPHAWGSDAGQVQVALLQPAPVAQPLPHAPQLAGSVCRLTQAPLQSVPPAGH
jgi:hypothetical protein